MARGLAHRPMPMATTMAIHAHPDAEMLLTGGTVAWLAAEGRTPAGGSPWIAAQGTAPRVRAGCALSAIYPDHALSFHSFGQYE
jgi:hypothetical protein